MRVALQTWGTDGDIRPFIALGASLVARGHTVTLSIASLDDRDYAPMCRAVGVSCVHAPERLGLDLTRWNDVGRRRNPLRVLRLLHEEGLFPSWAAMGEVAARLCADADVAVGHLFALPLRLAAEARGVPFASAAFWPGLVPDSARAPEGFPSLGAAGNRFLWRRVFDLLGSTVGAGYRAAYRQSKRPMPASLDAVWYAPRLNLLACSPELWLGAQMEAQHRLCGAWSTPPASEQTPLPAEVESFLAAGLPPIFLTLGSAGQTDPDLSEALLVAAATRSGLRALVQLGPGRRRPQASTQLCFTDTISHAALLPRCVAALHHGGAGTTHAVLAANLPAVVLGFTDEQRDWGRRLSQVGASAGTFRYWSANAESVATALVRAVNDPDLRRRAAALGARLRAEDGVAQAVAHLEHLAAAKR
jgi:sterol 3beta-glucosyltransferase/vancomycin aglycone glucosyltransferase